MEILVIVGFMSLWLSCTLWLVLCARLFRVIKTRHPQKFDAMGEPHLIQNSTLSTNKALFNFLYCQEWLELNDSGLSALGRFMRVLMIVLLTCFALIFLSLPFLPTQYTWTIMHISIAIALLLFLLGQPLSAEVFSDFPEDIQASANYVFYSHGLIVEGTDPRPVHPEFGVYQFPKIVQALHESGNINLIAHHRPAATGREGYARKLVAWVNSWLALRYPDA